MIFARITQPFGHFENKWVRACRYTMYADHHVECRANVAISKGEEITDHYVSPLFGTMYRRSHLRDGWYFDCKCPRCQGKGNREQNLHY